MPYVNIKITKEGNVTPEQKAKLISGVTNLLADVLHKNPATTVVVIDEVPLENWGLGGDPILLAREKRKAESPCPAGDGYKTTVRITPAPSGLPPGFPAPLLPCPGWQR